MKVPGLPVFADKFHAAKAPEYNIPVIFTFPEPVKITHDIIYFAPDIRMGPDRYIFDGKRHEPQGGRNFNKMFQNRHIPFDKRKILLSSALKACTISTTERCDIGFTAPGTVYG